jgi:hypothetical protein
VWEWEPGGCHLLSSTRAMGGELSPCPLPLLAEMTSTRPESLRPVCAPRCSAHLPRAPRGSDPQAGGRRAQVAAIGQAEPGG